MEDELARRLRLLRTPPVAKRDVNEEQVNALITKVLASSGNGQEEEEEEEIDDETLAHYLSLLDSNPLVDPSDISVSETRLNALLDRSETESASTLVPVQYFKPSLTASSNDAEDLALIARMMDEVAVEQSVRRDEASDHASIERRLQGLRTMESHSEVNETELGPPPPVDELRVFELLRERDIGSDDESESESEAETESSIDSDE